MHGQAVYHSVVNPVKWQTDVTTEWQLRDLKPAECHADIQHLGQYICLANLAYCEMDRVTHSHD